MGFSTHTLVASLVASSVGMGLFLYGKKQTRVPQLVVGLAMMVYPYFVAGALATWGTGVALVLLLAILVRAGL